MSTPADLPPGKIIARVAAGASLAISAGHASESLDKFASWFLAAFGAGFALSFAHLNEVSVFIARPTLICVAQIFLVAAALCVVQRYIAAVVASAAKSGKECREMGEKLQHIDIDEFFSQMLAGLPWLVRKMCQRQFQALQNGDYAVSGRMLIRITLIQGVLVGAELILLFWALTMIVNEIPV